MFSLSCINDDGELSDNQHLHLHHATMANIIKCICIDDITSLEWRSLTPSIHSIQLSLYQTRKARVIPCFVCFINACTVYCLIILLVKDYNFTDEVAIPC